MIAVFVAAVSIAAALSMVPVKGSNDSPQAGHCGHVSYDFEISRFEVSNADYAEFLNAVGAADPAELYHPLMQAHFWGGIIRTGEPGRYRYATKAGYGDLPVTFVSWPDAARYANWLTFGKPRGPQRLGTTEGDATSGSYDLAASWPSRNTAAVYALPTCDEWSKAAYFDAAARSFSRFPTGSGLQAGSAAADKPATANLAGRVGWSNPFPHLTPVASYAASASKSGTQNQAGNVLEWTEDRADASRVMLGGNVFMNTAAADADYKDSELPNHHLSTVGFRLVRLPGRPLQQRSGPNYAPPAAAAGTAPDWVRVGNPNNEADPIYRKGRVNYDFEIQRTEISNAEYAAFLNAVARHGDPFGLFSVDMQTGVGGGIVRSGAPGAFVYTPKPGWERRAAPYLSWFSLARMSNWEHFGRPSSGKEEIGVTEGTDRIGAYDTRKFPRVGEGYDPKALPTRRNPGAKYFIPNDDEWFKAAYFDPNLSTSRRYWEYPTRSSNAPALQGPGSANYQVDDALGEGAPYYIAAVDAHADSPGPWGTLQQGGNLWEWVEDWRSKGEGDCWRCNEWTRGLRGGSYNYTYRGLRADNVDPGTPDQAYFVYGGRLARAVTSEGWSPEASPGPVQRVKAFAQANPKRLAILGAAFCVLAALACLVAGYAIGYRRRRAT